MLGMMKVGVAISLGFLVIGFVNLVPVGVARAAPEFEGIARGHGPVAMYVNGQVPGLSGAAPRLLGEEIEQGLKLLVSAGKVVLFVAALGLVGLVAVGVIVSRTVTAPHAGARSLAKRVAEGPPQVPDEGIKVQQILAFTAAGTEFGVPIVKVREIVQYESVTDVPGAPALVRGVATVRGAVVPVLDLCAKFGRGVAEATKRSCILVVDVSPAGEPLKLGLFADAVNEIVELPAGDVEPPAGFGRGAERSCIVGLGKLGKRFLLLVDVDRILTASEAQLASEVARSVVLRSGVMGVRSLM